jgi:hypothetical protein
VTPHLKAHFAENTMHYFFLNIFKAYVLKNKNQFYKLNTIHFNATNVQNGHCLFLGKFQIDSNMHPLRFVTFPV